MTGIVAMPGPGRVCARLLDVVPGRTRTAVQNWFSGCDPAWRNGIRTASLDPYRGYATALTASMPDSTSPRGERRPSGTRPAAKHCSVNDRKFVVTAGSLDELVVPGR